MTHHYPPALPTPSTVSVRDVLLELLRRKRQPMWMAAPITFIGGAVVIIYGFMTAALLLPFVLGLALLLLAFMGPGITRFSLAWADAKFEAGKEYGGAESAI